MFVAVLVKYHVYLSDLIRFEEYSNIRICEYPSSGAELLHTDGLTDMPTLILIFRNFPDAPKMGLSLSVTG